MSPLYVRQLKLGPMENFVYLVGVTHAPEVLVVDPAWDVAAIEAAAAEDGKRIAGAFVSHCHGDHTNGLPELLSRHDVPVYANRTELDFSGELRARAPGAFRPLAGGDVLEVGPARFKALHTPGHTPGSHCLLCDDALVSGDTLFISACGRCDLRGGDPEAMYRSLNGTLRALPDGTRLLPGHDYADVPQAPLGEVKAKNPYFQFPDVESFVAFRMRPRK